MKEIGFRQLCAVALEQLQTNPLALTDYVEWKEATADRARALGYQRPTSERVWRAMDAIEVAEAKRGRPRPRPATSTSMTAPNPPDPTIVPRAWRKQSEHPGFTKVGTITPPIAPGSRR